MKQTKRKFLSLLLALAVMCSTIPMALADDNITWDEWGTTPSEGKTLCADNNHIAETFTITTPATCNAPGSASQSCTVCGATRTGTIPATEHSFAWQSNDTQHWQKCSVCDYETPKEAHTPASDSVFTWKDSSSHTFVCSTCNKNNAIEDHTWSTPVPVYTEGEVSTQHSKYCTVCDKGETHQHLVLENHDFDINGNCRDCDYQNANPAVGVKASVSSMELNVGETKTIPFYFVDADGYPTLDTTSVNVSSNDRSIAYVAYDINPNFGYTYQVTGYSAGSAIITVSTGGSGENSSVSIRVTVKNSQDVAVTVGQNIGEYYFDDSASTEEGTSIFDQIVSALDNSNYYPTSYRNYTITISGTTTQTAGTVYGITSSMSIASLSNIYLDISKVGSWNGSYKIFNGSTEVLSGNITITVKESVGIDILYTATLGNNVALDISDFNEFWKSYTNGRGELESVKINSVSGLSGTICYNHTTSEKRHDDAKGDTFYVTPSRSQKELNDLTFVPLKSGSKYNSGTVTINFTASGTSRSTSSSKTSASGTIVIVYTNGEVKAINYSASGSIINLSGTDFDTVYKQATASTAKNPSYYIQFLEAPTYGTLYANYGTNNQGKITGTELTDKNISTFKFSNKGTASSSINKVAYIPSYKGLGDTIRYAVYSGSSLLYVGTINFGVEKVTVEYYCGSQGVTFNASDFYTNSSLITSNYISFGTPTSGTLYKNYSNGKGTKVTAYDRFGFYSSTGTDSISSVTYIPTANFNGMVEIPFYSYTVLGGQVEGTIKIGVAKSFTDVPTSYWAYNYITRLTAQGVVNGVTATTFAPESQVKYGEALKMILVAAGYPKQTEGTGANWASSYLTLAYRYGIVSSTNVDLSSYISRSEIAAIAAKALKLSPATKINVGIVAPTDTTDGYVYALYNAGILNGETVNGKNVFNGSRTLKRSELSKIVCLVSDYAAAYNK